MVMYSRQDFEAAVDVSRETMAHLITYADMLQKWQKAKNLVSNKTLPDMWRRHFLDSAQLYPLIKKYHSESATLLDIGSGAGFPGLVLSVMGFDTVHMVESNGKKCSFMQQVARQTGAGATIHSVRIEEMPLFPVDIISSRACARILQLFTWAEGFITEKTEFWLLKGESVDDELTEVQKVWNMDVTKFDSLTEPTGVIVRLSDISRK